MLSGPVGRVGAQHQPEVGDHEHHDQRLGHDDGDPHRPLQGRHAGGERSSHRHQRQHAGENPTDNRHGRRLISTVNL